MVSLAWIQGDASRWKQYVANRVRDIQQESTPEEWRFIAGKENPADLCSRGVAAPELVEKDSLWWRGPPWLIKSKEEWPSQAPKENTKTKKEVDEERKGIVQTLVVVVGNPPALFNIERYSTLAQILRLTVYLQRAYRNAMADYFERPDIIIGGFLQADELKLAKNYWLRHLQAIAFPTEIDSLQENGTVLRRSKLAQFYPFLHERDGLIRMDAKNAESGDLNLTPDAILLPA